MFQVCQLVQTTMSAEVAGEIVMRGHFKSGSLKRQKAIKDIFSGKEVCIWVSFCRAGKMAVLCPFFLKVEPPCDQT